MAEAAISSPRFHARDSGSSLNERALSLGRLGWWTFDVPSQSWTLSPMALQLYGVEHADQPDRRIFLRLLTEVDRLRVNTAWDLLLNQLGSFDVEYSVEQAGELTWLWERAEVEWDLGGEPLRVVGVVQDITTRREHEQRLLKQANIDTLTGLPNRYMLDEYVAKSVSLAQRRNERVAMMVIDLDRFKNVNDTYGHAMGDRVLQAATQRMLSCLRSSDMLARQGGDEFVAVLLNVDHDSMAGLVALRLIEEVSQPYRINGHEISIGASVGIAVLPDDGDDPGQLIERADQALYGAKRAGRVTLRFFDPTRSKSSTSALMGLNA